MCWLQDDEKKQSKDFLTKEEKKRVSYVAPRGMKVTSIKRLCAISYIALSIFFLIWAAMVI
jgi:hypothetical protein